MRFWLGLWLTALALPALARVGGGESYSGGGSSHSGDGGGDGGAIGFILELLIRLIFYYPQVGIPLLIVCAIIYYTKFKGSHVDRQFRELQNWSAANSVERRRPPSLTELAKHDPNFSTTLFLDFVNSLYCKLLVQMGQDLSEIGGYLEKGLRTRLQSGTGGGVDAVIIGSTRLLGIHRRAGVESVEIEIESNLSQVNGNDLYVVDRLTLERAEGVKTNPQKRADLKLNRLRFSRFFRNPRGSQIFLRSRIFLYIFFGVPGPIPLDRGRNFMQIAGPDTSNRRI